VSLDQLISIFMQWSIDAFLQAVKRQPSQLGLAKSPWQPENQSDHLVQVGGMMAAGIGHSLEGLVSRQAKHEPVEDRHGLRPLPFQATAIFIQGVITAIMKLVLNAPVTVTQWKQPVCSMRPLQPSLVYRPTRWSGFLDRQQLWYDLRHETTTVCTFNERR
jgi:hypothetical protein